MVLDDYTVFKSVNWSYGDLRDVLVEQGFRGTDEEVLKLANASSKSLGDRGAEHGYEVIRTIVAMDMGTPPNYDADARSATLAVYPEAYALELQPVGMWQVWGGRGDEFHEALAEAETEGEAWEVAALHAEIDRDAK